MVSNVTSICCIFLSSCSPLTSIQNELLSVFVSKVMSHRLHYVVNFIFLSSLHTVVVNKHNEHKQLHNVLT